MEGSGNLDGAVRSLCESITYTCQAARVKVKFGLTYRGTEQDRWRRNSELWSLDCLRPRREGREGGSRKG